MTGKVDESNQISYHIYLLCSFFAIFELVKELGSLLKICDTLKGVNKVTWTG